MADYPSRKLTEVDKTWNASNGDSSHPSSDQHGEIMNTQRIYLGKNESGNIYLSKHSWDCGWYWGFGYLGNSGNHYHFSSYLGHYGNDNKTDVKEVFTDTWITQNQWWILRDLFIQAYALKKAAETYKLGGHQTSAAAPYRVVNEDMASRLNADLGTLLDTIWGLLSEWQGAAQENREPQNTVGQMVKRLGITAKIEQVDSNPNNPTWTDANHYKISLRRVDASGQKLQMAVYWSQGYGVKGDPDVADVLAILANEARDVDNEEDFYDWASNYGMEANSDTKLRYRATKRMAAKLKKFLGEDYDELLETPQD